MTAPRDVLEALGIEEATTGPAAATPAGAAVGVLAALDAGASTADEVTRLTGLPAGEVAAALVELELAGLVEARSGVYRR